MFCFYCLFYLITAIVYIYFFCPFLAYNSYNVVQSHRERKGSVMKCVTFNYICLHICDTQHSSVNQCQFTDKGFKETKSSEHSLVLLRFLFALGNIHFLMSCGVFLTSWGHFLLLFGSLWSHASLWPYGSMPVYGHMPVYVHKWSLASLWSHACCMAYDPIWNHGWDICKTR